MPWRLGPRKLAALTRAAVAGLLLLVTLAGPASADPSIVERERMRRAESAARGQEELQRGDAAYEAGDYREAVEAYGAARDMFPASQLTGDLRAAATQRLVQASVEHARGLAKGGRIEEARALLDGVSTPDIAPNDPSVREMKARIDDPVRTNPSLTAEHVADIDKVRRLLYEAQGFSDLGQFDRAHLVYESILQIDPTNVAARRGMESVSVFRSDAHRAGYDETRARMMMEVAEGWEIKPSPGVRSTGLQLGLMRDENAGRRSAEEKLKSLIVPVVDLEQVDLREAVDFVRQQSILLDTSQPDADRKGFSVVLDLGTGDSEAALKVSAVRFDLKLREVPLGTVLEYINAATGTLARIDEYAVVIRPLGTVGDDLYTREFRVPPDFLSRGTINRQQDDVDPFATEEKQGGLLGKRLTAQEYLSQQGVTFPEGASASFNPVKSILRVRNTSASLDYVEQVVNAAVEDEPVVVVIEATFINATSDRLEELGYDWLISPLRVGNGVFLGGGTVGNGHPFDDFGPAGTDPITSGLRSGDRTSIKDSIDGELQDVGGGVPSGLSISDSLGGGPGLIFYNPPASIGGGQNDFRAPGIVGLVGTYNPETVAGILRGLDNKKGVDVMTKKSVVTRSGQAASIESVQEFIYPTEYEPPEVPNSVGDTVFIDLITGETASPISTFATPATPTAFEMVKLGCVLEVEPLVDPTRNYVEVALKPTLRSFDGFINYGTPILGAFDTVFINIPGIGNPLIPTFITTTRFGAVTQNEILMPVFTTTTVNTSVTVQDGATLVLGGLLKSERVKTEDKTPILGDIPLLGRLFQSQSEQEIQNSLVILVTVKLLDPSGQPFRNR